jgi:CubicO group peptidase (beta-lactamase class C family)
MAGRGALDDARISRRALLAAGGAAAAAVALRPAPARSASFASRRRGSNDRLFAQLDARIEQGMKEFVVPGAAVAVLYRGREYIKGYGVTNVDYPVAVDGDTVFRIGSTTKTFTGTTIMRLVEQGRISLDARVRKYLPDFATADRSVSNNVTVRQLLNHSSGWLGDDLQGFGPGDDAITRFVSSMVSLPQLTPLGKVFAYNNAGLVVAGRIVEVVTRAIYEDAVQNMLLDPLGLDHTRYFSDQIIGFNVAASHNVVAGKAVIDPSFWHVPRSLDSTGGLISSARDMLRYARFHLGDGRAPDGKRLLTRRSLVAMRSNPGPGGTLLVELTGMGVTWMLRPSAERIPIVQHGGSWPGQLSGFMMVPERGFAMAMMTNSVGGGALTNTLFADDWALRRFAGVRNLPARPIKLSRRELRPYEGRYLARQIDESGAVVETVLNMSGRDGGLHVVRTSDGQRDEFGLTFYRRDYVLDLDAGGKPVGSRSNFLRGRDGSVPWFRSHGRLFARQ